MGRPKGLRTTAVGVVVAAFSSILLLAVAAAPAGATRSFTRAFADSVWSYPVWPQWVPRTVNTGARQVQLEVDWISVEPNAPPAGVDPTNPADPQFNFGYLDALVREFKGTALTPVFLVTDAPRWAEANGGPAYLEQVGAWEPNATAFGQLGEALAKRYSGSYPDPLHPGQTLPRVSYYQAWAEANFSVHLAPQWTRSGSRWVPNSPTLYRNMLNAFYTGVKRVNSSNFVISTGSGPFGDSPGACGGSFQAGPGCRMHPALFTSYLLCLNGATKPASCPSPPHFDALAIDPYEVGSPTKKALNKEDVSANDLGKLTKLLKAAAKSGRTPGGHKQLWVTEFGYDSNPPNPGGVPLAKQAKWLEESFFVFWREGVSTVFWYLVRDSAPNYVPGDYYTGVYYYNGTPKPSFEAYRFPFVVMPNGKKVDAWGISPLTGTVSVQRKVGKSWKTLFKKHVTAGSVFVKSVSKRLHGNFRATVGGETSLTWHK